MAKSEKILGTKPSLPKDQSPTLNNGPSIKALSESLKEIYVSKWSWKSTMVFI